MNGHSRRKRRGRRVHVWMCSQMQRWLCLLTISLPVLFWIGRVITRDRPLPVFRSSELRGYMRLGPHRMEQVRNKATGIRIFTTSLIWLNIVVKHVFAMLFQSYIMTYVQ